MEDRLRIREGQFVESFLPECSYLSIIINILSKGF
jgi:hypothetical protein